MKSSGTTIWLNDLQYEKLKEIEKNTKEGGSVHFIAHGVNGNVIFNNSIFVYKKDIELRQT